MTNLMALHGTDGYVFYVNPLHVSQIDRYQEFGRIVGTRIFVQGNVPLYCVETTPSVARSFERAMGWTHATEEAYRRGGDGAEEDI